MQQFKEKEIRYELDGMRLTWTVGTLESKLEAVIDKHGITFGYADNYIFVPRNVVNDLQSVLGGACSHIWQSVPHIHGGAMAEARRRPDVTDSIDALAYAVQQASMRQAQEASDGGDQEATEPASEAEAEPDAREL